MEKKTYKIVWEVNLSASPFVSLCLQLGVQYSSGAIKILTIQLKFWGNKGTLVALVGPFSCICGCSEIRWCGWK